MKRHLIISFVLIWSSFSTIHSQIIINAVLLDTEGSPIPFAAIINTNNSKGAMTNAEGRFDIDCKPNDKILIRCLGYQDYTGIADKLQNDSIIILEDAIYNIDDVIVNPIDASALMKRFSTNIRRNYPKRKSILKGVYKEYSMIENEYYGFLESNVDILIESIASLSRPNYKTKVYSYKSFRHVDRENVELISPESRFNDFWLYNYSILWNSKEYQYSYMGYEIYNETKLARINFNPKIRDISRNQAEGTFYIDMNTYALVYLQFEMIPNNKDFSLYKGRWQKPINGEMKIMFESDGDYYYPSYIISNQSSIGIISDWEVKPNNRDTVLIDFVFNFFTRDIEYNPKHFVTDSLSLTDLYVAVKDKVLDQSKDYFNSFVLETEKEKQLTDSSVKEKR